MGFFFSSGVHSNAVTIGNIPFFSCGPVCMYNMFDSNYV